MGVSPEDYINYEGHIVSEKTYITDNNLIKVDMVSLDSLVKDNKIKKVDYLKLDIEGAEIEALNGSVKTIRKFKPDLAISCHGRTAYFKVILFIHKICPNYKIYFVQHCGDAVHWRNYVVYATYRNQNANMKKKM